MAISIKAARVNAGLTQSEASAALNINKATLISWEKGRTAPTVSKFNEMCKLYGTKQEDIFLPSNSN